MASKTTINNHVAIDSTAHNVGGRIKVVHGAGDTKLLVCNHCGWVGRARSSAGSPGAIKICPLCGAGDELFGVLGGEA